MANLQYEPTPFFMPLWVGARDSPACLKTNLLFHIRIRLENKVTTSKVNSGCDGDRDSYDAMVLLTGRYDWEGLAGGGETA